MYRLKAVFAVLLSLALIAGFALLPEGIAIVSDFLSNGKPGTAPVFLTLTVTVSVSVSLIDFEETLISEYSKVVYERPKPKG